jgi:hypothetical protein
MMMCAQQSSFKSLVIPAKPWEKPTTCAHIVYQSEVDQSLKSILLTNQRVREVFSR